MKAPTLCSSADCLRVDGHAGDHDPRPKEVWSFFGDKDAKKIDKAGYATPRGGAKGAYQNHVYRNNKVIVPYERLDAVNLDEFKDGYVVRLLPDQYFAGPGVIKEEFKREG